MRAFFNRLATLRSIGMGALLFFTSHMVIRSMFYVGVGCDTIEIVTFFLVLLSSIALVHIFPQAFQRLRAHVGEYTRAPFASSLAALASLLLVLSILPEMGVIPLYLGGLLAGLSCGCLVTTWVTSLHVRRPRPRSFAIPPELVWAVVFYFCFRIASTFSPMVSDGLLFTLPLLSIAYLSGDRKKDTASEESTEQAPSTSEDDSENGETTGRASLVLVCVSAAFALLSTIIVYMAGTDDLQLDSSLNHMVLFEILLVGVVFAVCSMLHWLASQPIVPRHTGLFAASLLVLPPFAIGVAMGAVYEPDSTANLMWETSFWVMFVAVFAYDMRYSPYLCDGLAVGLMFESMCVAQLSTQLALHLNAPLWTIPATAVIALIYLLGSFRQLLATGAQPEQDDVRRPKSGEILTHNVASAEGEQAIPAYPHVVAVDLSEPDERCAQLAREYALTPSEAAILELMAHGRSARYAAEDLGVSFNTVRTHIRHVYEKLGIHSKQELIDMVEFES